MVALNTALVLWAAGAASSWADGLSQAQQALASGSPWQRLQQLAKALDPAEG